MAGEAKRLIDQIIRTRGKGDPTLTQTTITKLILKGLDPENFAPASVDEPATLAKIRVAATELGVAL